jgi:hypothetical protein
MKAKEKTDTSKRTAIIVGVLFIISTAAGVLNLGFLVPLLNDPDYLVRFSANETQVIVGVFLDLICAGAFVGLAVMIFPILNKLNERIALGYVVARSFEAVPFVVGVFSIISLLALSQHYVQTGAPDVAYFQTLGVLFVKTYDWMGQLLGARVFASLAALPFYYLLYQSKLLPRFISIWGLVGAPLYLASGLLAMFGLVDPLSPILVLMFLPAALLEMVLAVWLIVKGFNSAVIDSSGA